MLGPMYREHIRDTSYKTYVTDALRIICENTAKFGGGTSMTSRWAEVIESQNRGLLAHDTRPPEEIIADVAEKAGLIINHG
jgi:hypothetical protein